MVIISILKTVYNIITLKLTFPRRYNNKILRMDDGLELKIFRHMKLLKKKKSSDPAILIVRFKFKKFSHETNIKASRIPIPLIAGFPGFMDKLWMIDWKSGYWQGIYQWESVDDIEKYKKSFVLGIMNKRAVKDSISYKIIRGKNIDDYINSNLILVK